MLNVMHEICPVDLNDAAYVFKFAVNYGNVSKCGTEF